MTISSMWTPIRRCSTLQREVRTMSPARSDVKFTYAEYRALPESSPYQLIDGELLMSPAPSYRHATLIMRVSVALYNFVTAHRLGHVRAAPVDVILSPKDVLQPDILYISNARRHIIAPEGLVGAPDLCVEVLSEGTRAIDLGPKRVLYAKHGVSEYWVIDPVADTLGVYRFDASTAGPAATLTAADTLTTPLLPGFALGLADVFAP